MQEKAIKDMMNNCLLIQNKGQAVKQILGDLGQYYDADRAYIFEKDKGNACFNNTWEWCSEGTVSGMGCRQSISLNELKPLLDLFERTPLNGIMGLLEIDERHPDNKELIEEDRQATKDAGMNAHLSKPLDSREVLRTIVKYVNK